MKPPGAKRATKPAKPKKPKKPHYSKAEQKAFQAWIKAHPFKNKGFPKTVSSKPRKAIMPGITGEHDWIIGFNGEYPTCAAAAVANSLLAVRGIEATDDEVMRLHRQAGAASGDGMSIADCLASLMQYGLAGFRPAGYWTVTGELAEGDILGTSDGANDHAVTVTEYGLISWGAPLEGELADIWQPDGEAWHIQW